MSSQEDIRPARTGSLVPRLLVSLLIAGGFVWAMQSGGVPLVPPADAFRALEPLYLVLHILLMIAAVFLRTYRWIYLLRPISPDLSARRVFGVGLIGLAAVVFAPLRMGEVVRSWLVSQDGEVNFVQAAGTVVAERIVDGLLLTLLLAASLWAVTPQSPLPDHIGTLPIAVALVPKIARGALATFAAAFTAMALFYFSRATAHRLTLAVLGVVSKPLAQFVTRQVERLSDSLRFLMSARHGGAFLRDSLAYWTATVAAAWVLLRGVGYDASLTQATVIVGVMGLSTLLPSGPGFFGTYQLGAYCGLALFFPERSVLSAGALFTFLAYVTNLSVIGLGMFVGLALTRVKPRSAARSVG